MKEKENKEKQRKGTIIFYNRENALASIFLSTCISTCCMMLISCPRAVEAPPTDVTYL